MEDMVYKAKVRELLKLSIGYSGNYATSSKRGFGLLQTLNILENLI